MHHVPFTSGRKINDAGATGLNLDKAQIPLKNTLKVLGVGIDKYFSFKIQASQVAETPEGVLASSTG